MNKATFWHQLTPGTTYWRMEVPARVLPGQVFQFAPSDMIPDENGEPWFPRQEGACIFQFPGNLTTALILIQMQELGIRALVDVDDNYLRAFAKIPGVDNRSGRGWMERMDRSRLYTDDPYSNEQHRDICKFVDAVIVSTPELARRYRHVNENVYVCPNSVDAADWPADPPHQTDDVLRVGFAGSSSHYWDVTLIERALRWAQDQKDVEIVMIGPIEGPFRTFEWTDDLAEARRNMEWIDVGLCPLKDTPWNRCKSDIKMMEYAMSGACGIYSVNEAYRPWQGEPGYPAETAKEFLKVVKHLVKNREEARETARLARQYVLEQRTIEKNIHHWEEAINGDTRRGSTGATGGTGGTRGRGTASAEAELRGVQADADATDTRRPAGAAARP